MSGAMARGIGSALARYLACPRATDEYAMVPAKLLATTLRAGDVLLVDGSSRFATAIKYLTQSTWSHAALCVAAAEADKAPQLVEADVNEGVRQVPLSLYARVHTRICRPVGLNRAELESVIAYARGRIGDQYDLRNIIDLARYLLPTPPVPVRWRRRMLALGSGDPTRAICSSLIALAFQSVRYPILPELAQVPGEDPACRECRRTLLHIRHHSLFAPRDFDVSPYFEIVKPLLRDAFDPHGLEWADAQQTPAGIGAGHREVARG